MLYNKNDIKWEIGYMGYPTAYLKIKTPSISTILNDMIDDPEFEEWKLAVGDKADDILKFCADRGTAMHLYCEKYFTYFSQTQNKLESYHRAILDTEEELSSTLKEVSIRKGREFFNKIYNSPISDKISNVKKCEFKIYSPYILSRGALDILYLHNNNLCVSDFKNASKPIVEGSIKEYKYKVQLGGYAKMMDDMFVNAKSPQRIDYCSIICANSLSCEIQEVSLFGDELSKFKEIFSNYVKEWHDKNGQGFLNDIYKD